MKPRVFIGSSREAVSLAKVISEALADTCFCEVWCDHFFDVNASSFDTLCKKAILFDFAILLGAGDDLSLIRNHLHQTIRDNVLFEYGLFTGALGRQRTFILLHTKSKIPSDLYGVTTLSFRNEEELRQQCRLLLRTIEQEYSVCRISMLPSTASAIAYFENFISPLCQALLSTQQIQTDSETIHFDLAAGKIRVMVPQTLEQDLKPTAALYRLQNQLIPCQIQAPHRAIKALCRKEASGAYCIYDIPTCLNASYIAITLYTGKDFLGETQDFSFYAQKEIHNFVSAAQLLLQSSKAAASLVEIDLF